jgi:wobble nucleotide-excising tRNase
MNRDEITQEDRGLLATLKSLEAEQKENEKILEALDAEISELNSLLSSRAE